jgi:hypothetical protein
MKSCSGAWLLRDAALEQRVEFRASLLVEGYIASQTAFDCVRPYCKNASLTTECLDFGRERRAGVLPKLFYVHAFLSRRLTNPLPWRLARQDFMQLRRAGSVLRKQVRAHTMNYTS